MVEVSLMRTGTYVLGWDLGIQLALGKVARSEPREANQAPLLNAYKTKDDRWFFFTGLETARHLPSVLRALERTDCTTTSASPTPPPSAATAGRSSPCSTRSSPVGPSTSGPCASTPKACSGRPRRDRPTWWPTRSWRPTTGSSRSRGGALRSVNGPITFYDVDKPDDVEVPHLGEHTDEVLAELAEGRRTPRS